MKLVLKDGSSSSRMKLKDAGLRQTQLGGQARTVCSRRKLVRGGCNWLKLVIRGYRRMNLVLGGYSWVKLALRRERWKRQALIG